MASQQQNVSARRQVRKESAFLNNVSYAMAKLSDIFCVELLTIELNFAAIGLQQTDDETEEGRFTATARPDQDSCFPAFD